MSEKNYNQSYLYNPAYTPFAENVTGKYGKDDRVRYFIDLRRGAAA